MKYLGQPEPVSVERVTRLRAVMALTALRIAALLDEWSPMTSARFGVFAASYTNFL